MRKAYFILCALTIVASCRSEVFESDTLVPVNEHTTLPTDDTQSQELTFRLPTAVLSAFQENSTGAALLRRLPQQSGTIGGDTRLVLLKGSDFANISQDDLLSAALLYMNGGFIALETPTEFQTAQFLIDLAVNVTTLEIESLSANFIFPEDNMPEPASAARIRNRIKNLHSIATKAGEDDPNAVFAELLIFGPMDFLFMSPFKQEEERTAYLSGHMADAAVRWFNRLEAEYAPTKADGGAAVNSIMNASETFTFVGDIDMRDWYGKLFSHIHTEEMTLRSWGVHNMEANKDFYYISQNVVLQMGHKYVDQAIYFPIEDPGSWYPAKNYGDYNHWFGSFLSRYDTSMWLQGEGGTIFLEDAKPVTDNYTSTSTISLGSNSSTTTTLGITWGISGGGTAGGPTGSINVGGSYSVGTTNGTSFTMGMSTSTKDLAVTRNSEGGKVKWSYKGTLPKFYIERHGNLVQYCHQTPADILVNDASIENEICWSVTNPVDDYDLCISSVTETAALLYSDKKGDVLDRPSKYEYTSTDEVDAVRYHTLLQPNRAMQTWRMSISIDEWENAPVQGALSGLEASVKSSFPDLYASVFQIADRTPSSLSTINGIINYSKNVFANRSSILKNIAKDWGVKTFTINWACDDMSNIRLKEGYVVSNVTEPDVDEPSPYRYVILGGTESSDVEDGEVAHLVDGDKSTEWFVFPSEKKEGMWYAEFMSTVPISPTRYVITTSLDGETRSHPANWRVLAKASPGDAWTEIAHVTNGMTTSTPTANARIPFNLDVTGPTWQYFRFEVTETAAHTNRLALLLAEFEFY